MGKKPGQTATKLHESLQSPEVQSIFNILQEYGDEELSRLFSLLMRAVWYWQAVEALKQDPFYCYYYGDQVLEEEQTRRRLVWHLWWQVMKRAEEVLPSNFYHLISPFICRLSGCVCHKSEGGVRNWEEREGDKDDEGA